jgi:hypothetical protein
LELVVPIVLVLMLMLMFVLTLVLDVTVVLDFALDMALVVFMTLVLLATLHLTPLFLVMHHVMGRVDVVIPMVGDEVNRSIAGVIFATMLRPMSFMSRRDMEVQWLWRRYAYNHRGGDYNHWTRDEQLGRGHTAADGDLPVHAGHADIHRNTDVAGQRGGG